MIERSEKEIAEIKSLIALLDDEDENIFIAARDRLLQHQEELVLLYLPELYEFESLASSRIHSIRERILRSVYKDKFRTLKKDLTGDIDLQEGVFLIAKQRFVNLDMNYLESILNQYSLELKEKLSSVSDHTEILRRTVSFFVDKHGFMGNLTDYYNENNHYINRVLESKTGIPITLSIIYLLVGRRIDLPMRGIGLPGHFTLRFSFGSTNVFVDPYNNGKILTINDCEEIVKNLGFAFTEDYLQPVNNKQILERMLRNIILSLEKKKESERTERIETIRQFIDSLNTNV